MVTISGYSAMGDTSLNKPDRPADESATTRPSLLARLLPSFVLAWRELLSPTSPSPGVAYTLAVTITLAATFLRMALAVVIGPNSVRYILYFPAVVVSAWIGGLGPALVAVVLASIISSFLFIEPIYSFSIANPADIWSICLFIFSGLCIATIGETQKIARIRALRSADQAGRHEHLLATTLRSIGDGVIVTDAAGRVILINRVAERLTGWTEPEAIGQPSEIVFPIRNERMSTPVESPIRAALQQKTVIELANHTVLTARDGSIVHIEDTAAPIVAENGEVQGAVLVFRDVSEQRRQRHLLQESEERLRAIIDSTPSIIYVKDQQGRYTMVNRAFTQLKWLPDKNVVGKTARDVFSPELYPRIAEHDRRVLQHGESIQEEEYGPTSTTYLSTKFPLRDASGAIYALCGVSTDITARKNEEIAQQFLNDASTVLASSLDYEQTLKRVTELAVPDLADWCTIDMAQEDGSLRLLAVAHADSERIGLAYELRERYPLDPHQTWGLLNVVRTGETEVYYDIDDEMIREQIHDDGHLALVRRIGFRSMMIVPIISRGQAFGVITLVISDPKRACFTERERALAEGLAVRVALAIENARLYRAAQDEISERRRVQEALTRHQVEIEALNLRMQQSLRETHHRVKNNLQVISALVDMQLLKYGSTVPGSELERLTHHIRALASIHDLLTQQARTDAEVAKISIKEIMERLLPTYMQMASGRPITLTFDDLLLPIRQSSTIAVLVNELVSNALKHGRGEIAVSFKVTGDRACLQVDDAGPGFPEDFDPARAASTGLDLIGSLVQIDLRGTATYENRPGGGARVIVDFPVPTLLKPSV